MTTTPISDHKARALERLLETYKKSDRLIGLIGAYADQIQELEDCFNANKAARSIDAATGAQLDEIGKIVGIDRLFGQSDDAYRVFIYARIGANISQGETERVISVYKLITGATFVQMIEYFPASIALLSDGYIDPDIQFDIGLLMKSVVAAGVSLDYFGTISDSIDFIFGDALSSVPDIYGLGFGSSTDPTVGGRFAPIGIPGYPDPSVSTHIGLQQGGSLLTQDNNFLVI